MLTDKQSLYLVGIVTGLFFLAGINNYLEFLIVKIILGVLFVLIIVNLFLVSRKKKA